MESKRPQTILRFRTKKQKNEWAKTAKLLKFSLNEYIIRVMEEKHNPQQSSNQFSSLSVSV